MSERSLRRTLRCLPWCILLALGQPQAQEAAGGQILDRVVATVEGRAITLSELEFEARVLLVERGGSNAASAPLDDAALRSALELGIAQRLQNLDADRLRAFPVDEAELAARAGAFEAKLGGPRALEAFLARNEAEPSELAEVLARELRAEKILDSKVRLRAQVSEAEVRQAFEEQAGALGRSYEKARGPLRERLLRQKYALLARQELASIRSSGSVRIVAPFARPPELRQGEDR